MKKLAALLLLASLTAATAASRDNLIAPENLLWPAGITDNIVNYERQNIMRSYDYSHPDAPLGTCRVYSNVSAPTYFLYQPDPQKNTRVAMVVLPGGAYTDIWLDTEGHDIALYFKNLGITSLVLKYRTNTADSDGNTPLTMEQYLPAAIADAKQAVKILRSSADKLDIDPNKIGIGGFSAGAHLALSVCLEPETENKISRPNFAFLIYPGLDEDIDPKLTAAKTVPPLFIVNGQQDTVTPPDKCALFFAKLCEKNTPAELHIYRKGNHGFTLGIQKGNSTSTWPKSFISFLKDIDIIEQK